MKYTLAKEPVIFKSPIEQVLENRGIEDIPHYLKTTDEDILNPQLLAGMLDGAKLLMKHIAEKHRIYLIVDCDADGFTSSAIFLNYLHRLFPTYVENNIDYFFHTGKQHGLEDQIISDDYSLVVAIDSSSNDFEIHQELKDRGIDVLVLDHHEASHVSEAAVVINNQLCDYPNKSLCGAGIAFKFISFLDELLNKDISKDYLDLVALGLIADVMDFKHYETRRLIDKGLENIRNPYFTGMVEKNAYSLKMDTRKYPSPDGVAFYVAPYINGTIRVGEQDEKLMLFKSMLEWEAYKEIPSTKRGCAGQMETIAERAVRDSVNIKNRQAKIRDTNFERIEQIIEDRELYNNKVLLVPLEEKDIDRRITGLVANLLMNKYQKPILLLGKSEDGSYSGSARNSDKNDLTDFRQFIEDYPHSFLAAGHKGAFGAGISAGYLEDFIEYSNNVLADYDFSTSYKVDFIWKGNEDFSNDILTLGNFYWVWGQGVSEPLVAVERVKITKDNISLTSGNRPTLKITLPSGVSLVKFGSSVEEYNELYSELGCVIIDVIGKAERNEWNGTVTPQIIVTDYEIVSKQLYYF